MPATRYSTIVGLRVRVPQNRREPIAKQNKVLYLTAHRRDMRRGTMRSIRLPKMSSMAKTFGVLLTLGLLAAQVFPAVGVAWAAPSFPDPAMEAVWNRTDKPVQDGTV